LISGSDDILLRIVEIVLCLMIILFSFILIEVCRINRNIIKEETDTLKIYIKKAIRGEL